MSDTDEVDRLHGRLVEGALDEDGRARLQTLLADSQMRRYFAVLMQVDGGLRELHRAPSVDLPLPLPLPLSCRPATRRRVPLWLPALAATVLMASGLASGRLSHRPRCLRPRWPRWRCSSMTLRVPHRRAPPLTGI